MAEDFENSEVVNDAPVEGTAEEPRTGKGESRSGGFRSIIDGSLLTREQVVKQLPFVLFLSFLAIVYIANRYHAERILRETTSLQTELKELRSEQISITSELMRLSQQSEVARLVREQNLGLKESVEPPKKIMIKKEN